MTIHFPTPAHPMTFRQAYARYQAARAAALAAPTDEAAQARWASATDAVLSSWAVGPSDVCEKIVVAITEERTGLDVLRGLFWDLQRVPRGEELVRELSDARALIANDLETMLFSFREDPESGREGIACPEEAELVAEREERLARIDRVLARAG